MDIILNILTNIDWQHLITGLVIVFVITYFTQRAAFIAKEGELKFGLFIKSLGLMCLIFSVTPSSSISFRQLPN